MAKRLSKELREHLVKTLGITPESVSVRLAEIKRTYPHLTQAAAAQILAQKKGKSILGFLDEEDRKSLPSIQASAFPSVPVRRVSNGKTAGRIMQAKPIVLFSTSNRFVEKHIQEINGTYAAQCYTATFILCRKVMENLIVDVLRHSFPKERNLYEDAASHRSLDYSVVLDHLFKKRTQFNTKAFGAIVRIKQKATAFKNDANDKAHSLFHIATKKEIDDAKPQEIFDLIEVVMKESGMTP